MSAQNGKREDFLGTRLSLQSQYLLLFSPDRRLYIVQNMCIHAHIFGTVHTVHELLLLPNNTAVKHFYTNRSGTKC